MKKVKYPERAYLTPYIGEDGLFMGSDVTLSALDNAEYIRADICDSLYLQRLANAKKMAYNLGKQDAPQWHDVNEALPEFDVDVLVMDDCRMMAVAWLTQQSNGTTCWWSCDDRICKPCITHWCEIPKFEEESK